MQKQLVLEIRMIKIFRGGGGEGVVDGEGVAVKGA